MQNVEVSAKVLRNQTCSGWLCRMWLNSLTIQWLAVQDVAE
jgi:hypothetical protein